MSSYTNNIRKSRPSSSSTSSSSYARPRSVYSSPSRNSAMYSSLGLSAPYLGSSSYSSTIPSYSTSTYGGTASGYGGLTITPSSSSPSFSSYSGRTASPSPSSSSLHSHASPSSRHSHATPSSRHSHASPSSRHHHHHTSLKRNSYQSPLTRFDSSNSLASSKSYGSEGYASGGDTKSSPTSRLGSISSSLDSKPSSAANSPGPCSENGEIDYKALYEEVVVDNERLRRQLQKTEEDLLEAKITIEKQSTNAGKSTTLSETEKRERRAMERKLSEMEEELKQMEQLRQENQRLKDENGALIRVISKLSK